VAAGDQFWVAVNTIGMLIVQLVATFSLISRSYDDVAFHRAIRGTQRAAR
jgi:hypothetical protein